MFSLDLGPLAERFVQRAKAMPETQSKALLARPEYASRFRCIGPECEDTCCAGWAVYVDEAAWGKYRRMDAGPLRTRIDANLERMPARNDGSPAAQFAQVRLTGEHVCPFLNAERLCQIQVEHGEGHLPRMCANYPRIARRIDGLEEMSLSLSCPEAARLVLLTPQLPGVGGDDCFGDGWHERPVEIEEFGDETGTVAPIRFFWAIREFAVKLLTDRRYPLWQRMFLLGAFTRRMDALVAGGSGPSFAAVLRDFEAAVRSGTLRASMDGIPLDLGAQLDFVLRLAGLPLPRAHVGQRFLDTLEAFTRGIGNGPGATMGTLIAGYAEAHDRWYAPFMRANPQILENLIVNTVFRTLFPFGHTAGRMHRTPAMAREFALLAAQFALVKGLLIGVAGSCREGFGADEVVRTVQSAAKHFEHHAQFLEATYALLVETKLDNARGLTMLTKN